MVLKEGLTAQLDAFIQVYLKVSTLPKATSSCDMRLLV